MHGKCESGNCGTGYHGYSSCHSGSCGCGSGKYSKPSACGTPGCECGSKGKAASMICLSMKAKHELLKEKVKEKLLAREGKRFDAVADLLVDGLIEWHASEQQKEKSKAEFHSKLEALMNHKK